VRILVVEDEHKIASAIKKGLEQERFAVDIAYSGVEGFDLAATEDYDCIILDLMLPEMDGFEFCRRLRQEKIQTPILILTARGNLDDKVQGLELGADDYLTKPFSFEELLARVRALIRRPRNLVDPVLKVADLELDTNSFEVKRGKRKILLSKKEYAVLEYLMRNEGKILTKEQIISHVWDYDADILPNTVEVFIKNLRRKIDKPFSRHLIKTVRGFGYKIES
jgi:DNA-binding response OmpR family regulator